MTMSTMHQWVVAVWSMLSSYHALDTVSQSVRAWNIGSALVRNGAAKCLPVPNASQSSYSGPRVSATDTANTATSVSTVLISIFRWPAWFACNIMRLSASSWLHGERSCSRDLIHHIPSWLNASNRALDKKFGFVFVNTKKVPPIPWNESLCHYTSAHTLCSSRVFEGVFYVSMSKHDALWSCEGWKFQRHSSRLQYLLHQQWHYLPQEPLFGSHRDLPYQEVTFGTDVEVSTIRESWRRSIIFVAK